MKISGAEKTGNILEKLKKNKYVLAVIIVGLALILWPGEKKEKTAEKTGEPLFSVSSEEQKISEALSGIDGAGRVTVVLTLKTGTQQIVATDEDTKVSGSGETQTKKSAVIISKGSAQQSPVTLKYIYPEYQGALVVAEGADDAGVRLELKMAVAGLTGLGTDKITVTKMKTN